jgi:hypothetical protein
VAVAFPHVFVSERVHQARRRVGDSIAMKLPFMDVDTPEALHEEVQHKLNRVELRITRW